MEKNDWDLDIDEESKEEPELPFEEALIKELKIINKYLERLVKYKEIETEAIVESMNLTYDSMQRDLKGRLTELKYPEKTK